MGGRMLDTAQAAQRMGCSIAHVNTLIRTGKVGAINISAGSKLPRWRIQEEALVEFMKAGESGLTSRLKTR